MRQTLFFIPHEVAGQPLFGAGWILLGWAVFSFVLMAWMIRRQGWNRETTGYLPFLVIVAAAVYFLLPLLEVKLPGTAMLLGLPIRGYGVMLLFGIVSGVGFAVYRARQVGIDQDLIYSLAFWMFLWGIGGARLFWVIQYWKRVDRETIQRTLLEIVKFNEGGLVVYGSLIGALVGFALFTRWHQLPVLRLADVIAPSMIIGLAIGRIGCLLNGCCYGGLCEEGVVSIRFPKYSTQQLSTFSPPYGHHLQSGNLHGIVIGERDGRPIVLEVDPESSAKLSGIPVGATIRSINEVPVSSLTYAHDAMLNSAPHLMVETSDGSTFQWSIGNLPDRSLPVHPTQLYSSLNAFLLFVVLWFLFPLRTWDGVIFGVVLTVYPVTRFLLEVIRSDESGHFGTALTISQILSILALILMIGYWPYILRQPRLIVPK